MKIFVNIVSYKDILLWDTINDCIDNCSDPARLHFGIVDQADSPYDIQHHRLHKQITYFHIDPQYSRGPCWARSMAYSFYKDEDYVLQVDAHTVFDRDWDLHLINQLQELEGKCLLSSYPPEFEFVDDIVKKHEKQGVATVFRPKDDAEITDDDPSFSFKGYFTKSDKSIPGFHIAGGFLFAPGKFVNEIPYDPSLYFLGEEQNLAVRAWTHGWDIYHPTTVPVYHLYHTKAQRPLHWNKDEDADRPVRWYELRERSRKRLGDLLLRGKNLGVYGLGTVRTLEQFAEFSGIDYPNKKIEILKF